MPFTVRIAHHSSAFIVEENETILDAALRQGFDMPHSCCEGICGSCAGQIIDGVVRYDHPDQLLFDETDRAAGNALFCSAYAESDLLIDMPGMSFPLEKTVPTYTYQVLSLKLISVDVYQVLLMPESKPMPYLAGQYIEACMPNESGRFFSIANAPDIKHNLMLHVRCQANNLDTKKFIDYLAQHQAITLRGPLGHCFYHPKPALPTIMVAVGTGFAPMKAILENIFLDSTSTPCTLFWAGKSLADLYQLPLVQQWLTAYPNFHFVPVLDCPEPIQDWQGVMGNVLDHVLQRYPQLANRHIYFAGPAQLTFDALDRFIEKGAQTCYLYSDAFDL